MLKWLKFNFVALLLGLVFLISCGSDDKEADTNPANLPALTDLATIEQTADRGTLVGRQVDLDAVPVDRVTGTYVFWIGSRSGIPVFRKDRLEGTATEHVRAGGKARITGTIRLAGSVPSTDPLWERINEGEKQDILGARIFIMADKVQVIH